MHKSEFVFKVRRFQLKVEVNEGMFQVLAFLVQGLHGQGKSYNIIAVY